MKRIVGALVIMAGLAFSGCASKVNMNRSDAVPAAEARVTVDKEKGNMREVMVEVRHLAPAGRVSPQAAHYVVWLQPMVAQSQSDPVNLGVLKIGNDQQGELEAKTPYQSFQVFITAEEDPQTTVPVGTRVLWATVN